MVTRRTLRAAVVSDEDKARIGLSRDDAEASLPRQMGYNSLSDVYRTQHLDK